MLSKKFAEGAQRVVAASIQADRGQRAHEGGCRSRSVCRTGLAEQQARCLAAFGEEAFFTEEEIFGGHQRPFLLATVQCVTGANLLPELLDGGGQISGKQYQWRCIRRSRPQVIHDRAGLAFFKEERQVVLDAGGQGALGNVPINAGFGGVALEHFAETLAEQGPAAIIGREFAGR